MELIVRTSGAALVPLSRSHMKVRNPTDEARRHLTVKGGLVAWRDGVPAGFILMERIQPSYPAKTILLEDAQNIKSSAQVCNTTRRS